MENTMDLKISISLNARNIPFELFEKIQETIQWQVAHKQYHAPFKKAEMVENDYGMLAPSFHIDYFSNYNEICSGSADFLDENDHTFLEMAPILECSFSFTQVEINQLSLLLGRAAMSYKILEAELKNTSSNFFICSELLPKIILDPNPDIELISGLKTYW